MLSLGNIKLIKGSTLRHRGLRFLIQSGGEIGEAAEEHRFDSLFDSLSSVSY